MNAIAVQVSRIFNRWELRPFIPGTRTERQAVAAGSSQAVVAAARLLGYLLIEQRELS